MSLEKPQFFVRILKLPAELLEGIKIYMDINLPFC
jgi:hypothetical protein